MTALRAATRVRSRQKDAPAARSDGDCQWLPWQMLVKAALWERCTVHRAQVACGSADVAQGPRAQLREGSGHCVLGWL